MCVKLSFGDLNPGIFSPHLTSTYTCRVITVPKICSGTRIHILNSCVIVN